MNRLSHLIILLNSILGQCYWDPAKRTQQGDTHRLPCRMMLSNHPEILTRQTAVLPAVDKSFTNITAWTKHYRDAFASADLTKLLALKRSGEGWILHPGTNEEQTWFAFINGKAHMIDALENRAGLVDRGVLGNNRTLLDIGSGHGFLDAYLMAAHGTRITGLDVQSSYQCPEVLASPLLVHFFDGAHLAIRGSSLTPKSYDAVTFMSVLHHAAHQTAALLAQAASVARDFIIVLEDLETPSVKMRNFKHDPRGIFRTDEAWKELFASQCCGFTLVADGFGAERRWHQGVVMAATGNEHRMFQKYYVLKRTHSCE